MHQKPKLAKSNFTLSLSFKAEIHGQGGFSKDPDTHRDVGCAVGPFY